jgi:uncharacterized membrane protein
VKNKNPPENPHGTIAVRQTTEAYQGPVPPPEFMARYNEIIPNGAERLLAMAEQRQNAEIELAKKAWRFEKLKLAAAFVLSLAALGMGGYLAATQGNIGGYASFIGAVAGLIAVFIKASSQKDGQ